MKSSFYLILIAILIFLSTSSCGSSGVTKFKSGSTAGYIPNRISTVDPKGSFGTSFFDVTKRVGISSLYEKDTFLVKYLAEEQPDAGISVLKDLTTKIAASKGSELQATIDLTNTVSKTLEQITNKSHSLNFLRSSLYRLNEATYNGFIDKEAYERIFCDIILASENLQTREFGLNPRPFILNEPPQDSTEIKSKI